MVTEFTSGQTEVNSKEIGKKIKSLAMVFTTGRMEESMKATGNKIICMDKVCINGQMEDNMKDNMLMIKKKVTGFTSTQMADATKVNG